jgi:hypothetical protein
MTAAAVLVHAAVDDNAVERFEGILVYIIDKAQPVVDI